ERAVYDYLKKTNRPYSATDIFNNLQSKYPKSMITKSLERLVQDDLITSKTFGKMTIYVQENDQKEEMEQLDKNIENLTEKVNALKDENRKKDTAAQKLKSQLTTTDAKAKMKLLFQQNASLQQRIEECQASGNPLIKEEDKIALENQINQYQKLWKKRKAIFRDIGRAVFDHVTMPIAEFKEELGIEEDP
ncbi:Tat binding protein 1-interacting, partial [Backusella circina FSU 941]